MARFSGVELTVRSAAFERSVGAWFRVEGAERVQRRVHHSSAVEKRPINLLTLDCNIGV